MKGPVELVRMCVRDNKGCRRQYADAFDDVRLTRSGEDEREESRASQCIA